MFEKLKELGVSNNAIAILTKNFKTTNALLYSTEAELVELGIDSASISKLEILKEIVVEYATTKMIKGTSYASSNQVFLHFNEYFKKETREHAIILCLNAQLELIKIETIAIGTTTACIYQTKEIYRRAILCNAVSIIFVHNHPSGSSKPSEEDKKTTNTLKKAGELMNIPLVDHVIIGKNEYFSFVEEGLL